jgi:uncharacterized protein
VLDTTGGHPYATQALCYFLWQRSNEVTGASNEDAQSAIEDVLRAEDSHFAAVWDAASSHQRILLQALSLEEGRPLTGEYRRRHGLPGPSSIQRALEALERDELVARANGRAWISEPFLAQWVRWKTR